MLARILKDLRTERVILGLIIFNAVTLGLETSPSVMDRYGPLLHALDRAVLTVFVVELAARMMVFRLAFFRDPWSLFDLFVVGIALVPATGSFSVLRALRILRVLRLVTAVPSLKRVVGGLVTALPGMGSILLLLLLIFYVFSVMAAKLFGATKPELFGSFGAAAYTLFQVMTFDDWSAGIVKPLMDEHPWAWLFFVVFILLSTFMVLNLFIGVVVSALDEETARDAPKITHPAGSDERILAELAALRAELGALRRRAEERS
ncbi:MAG TPA: ion transporter [Beijerinckiaceae bacterium]|jgi:voltage-gated sodium channel|nr:ion transporter [Microvirga sp.]HZB37762.1 ion transporter [Beijerinckiaceae bacterium]